MNTNLYINRPELMSKKQLYFVVADLLRRYDKKNNRRVSRYNKPYYFLEYRFDNFDISVEAWREDEPSVNRMKQYTDVKIYNNITGKKLLKHEVLEIIEKYDYRKT